MKLVYLIDDSPDAIDLALTITEEDPRFQLKCFLTEPEFLQAIEDKFPDAVILDLNLGQNITGTIIAIKLGKLYPNLPIAIYTNYEKNRVAKLLPNPDRIKVWGKSEIGVGELSNAIFSLLNG